MSTKGKTTIVWFRTDLRVCDNPALFRAAGDAHTVVPVFVWAPDEEAPWAPGPASRWWLARSLRALAGRLAEDGLPLVIREGPTEEALATLARSTGADRVVWNEHLTPQLRGTDARVAEVLDEQSIARETYASRILHDPESVRTTSGGPYHVFTPFWKKFRSVVSVDEPLPAPDLHEGLAPADGLDSVPLAELEDLLGGAEPDQAGDAWSPGEAAAVERLDYFCDELLAGYDDARDRPATDGTSRLSPHLHHGEISPRQVWHAVQARSNEMTGEAADSAETFLQELVWREFAYHLLHHYPETPTEPLRDKYEAFKWRDAPELTERWRRGQTGYPIVDAGMRQLRQTGWMHNRVRMIVASFLTKDLLVPWQTGARHFWERLVDADLANNTLGWQWAAGCGADAQPFFRIFNPVSQSRRHDPDGEYIRRWVPELDGLDESTIHEPWKANTEVDDYPDPIVDHAEARELALAEWERIK